MKFFLDSLVSNQLEQVFNFIDANGDGKISPLELRKLLLCLGHDKSKVTEEVERMVKEADSNGDGYIDLNEYMKVVVVEDNESSKDSSGGGDHDLEHRDHDHKHGFDEDVLMDVFLVFDADQNGLISARELSNVLNKLGFDHCGIEDCLLMIKGVDKGGDGFVDFEEFKLMMSVQGFKP
ncbi:putative calcium-binding protein CML10 [Drosera capensis]